MERKLKPFTCYFCSETITNDTEMGHTSVCGNVLIPCPNKCGSYIPRMEMNHHKKECVNRVGRSMPRLTDVIDTYETNPPTSTSSLDRKIHDTLSSGVATLRNEIQKIASRLSSIENKSNFINSGDLQQRGDVSKIIYQLQSILEWKRAVDFTLETVKQSLKLYEKSSSDFTQQCAAIQQKLTILEQLQSDLNQFRHTLAKEQEYNQKADLEFAKKIDEFNNIFEQENSAIAALWNDQNIKLNQTLKEVDELKSTLNEQKAKLTTIVLDLKSTTQIAEEASEKLEIQQREFIQAKKDIEQLKLDLEILEDLAGSESIYKCTTGTGHIIWKISDFEAKMSKAKESETVIKSQIFYTHDFGYRVRILVYLNGLNKWKDRYTLISLHVLKGEFDALLKWPCHIEAVVTLRDLENVESPKNFSKFITAKRYEGDEENEDPQESSSSYIFIPHSTLLKEKYLKNDQIFLDIKVEQNQRLLTETST